MKYTKIGNYYVRRPQAAPYHATWVDHARLMAEVVADTAILLVLLFGLPLVVWMWLA